MPVILPPTDLTPPAFIAAAPAFAAPVLGSDVAITLPDFAAAAPSFPAIAVAASGAATRNESLFIRIDAPLREVVVIPAPLA